MEFALTFEFSPSAVNKRSHSLYNGTAAAASLASSKCRGLRAQASDSYTQRCDRATSIACHICKNGRVMSDCACTTGCCCCCCCCCCCECMALTSVAAFCKNDAALLQLGLLLSGCSVAWYTSNTAIFQSAFQRSHDSDGEESMPSTLDDELLTTAADCQCSCTGEVLGGAAEDAAAAGGAAGAAAFVVMPRCSHSCRQQWYSW
mmetsp:Transcript_20876/g.59552  ORF Transcript_20876/g.59552 Transcript_20876/m.59552 type:complete len:204 (-) Transcript_20876:8-619(-)